MTKSERDSVICDVCADDMLKDNPYSLIGLTIEVDPNNLESHAEYKKLIKHFGKADFKICFTCWLKSLGVKPKNVEI